MPREFFDSHPDYVGVRESEITALCTAVPQARDWLRASLTHVFRAVPGLAGVSTIPYVPVLDLVARHCAGLARAGVDGVTLRLDGWRRGIDHLERAVAAAPVAQQPEAQDELRFARAAQTIFRSVRNQVRLIQLGESRDRRGLLPLLDDEIATAKIMFRLCQEDSRIGFEAANQYFIVPGDLLEKIVNCEYLKTRFD